ncbi:MAG: FAD-binding oxidoreductase [Bacteroidota bacterium]
MIIKNNIDEIQSYLSDASNYSGYCDSVCFPESDEEIIELLKSCSKDKIRVTVSGNGTGLTGSRVPEGGIVIFTGRLNKILELNETQKYVVAQPGVILKDLQDFVEEKKLFYPPDPTERNCFIGATVATNSSGARTFKYGPTRDYILAIKVILADGDVINIERGQYKTNGYEALLTTENGRIISFELPKYEMPATKNTAGYFCKENMDLIDLFIGSEGTLGIITQIKLKLIDFTDEVLSCVVFFNSENDALNFIDEARKLSKSDNLIDARGLEFFDEYSLQFLQKDYPNIPAVAKSAVWFEQELIVSGDDITSAWLELIIKHNGMEEESWIAVDKKEQEKFKDFRHAISWKVNEYITQRGLKKVGTDVAVPNDRFRDFYNWCKRKVKDADLKYVVYGHFGNSHPHLNMLPENHDQYLLAKKIYAEICAEAAGQKGTVSAEHGIGKLKRDYLYSMYGENVIKEMARIKLIFDPDSILSIGNIFDEKYLH